MAANRNLVDAARVILLTGTRANLQEVFITPHIEDAQIEHLEEALTEPFYEEIIDGVCNSNLSAANQNLFDNFIEKYLCQMILHYAMPFIQFDISDKGIQVNEDPNGASRSTTTKEFAIMRDNIRSNADVKYRKLLRELQDNSDLYPTYDPVADTPTKVSVVHGIILR